MGQIAARVGDIDGNVAKVLDVWHRAADAGCDLVIFTELTIPGYPPEDLLLKREFVDANVAAIDQLADRGPHGTAAVVGFVGSDHPDAPTTAHWDVALATRSLTNSAAVLADGTIAAVYDKVRLPNYGVFDEARYFASGHRPCVVNVAGVAVGVTICEDLWTDRGIVAATAAAGAQVVASLNASPYHRGKREDRLRWARHHATTSGLWIAYCNVVGGQDEVVFDGDSMLVDPTGNVVAQGAQFAPDLLIADVSVDENLQPGPRDASAPATPTIDVHLPGHRDGQQRQPLTPLAAVDRLDPVGEVWQALVIATGDYCRLNGFDQAVVGLSGGIDSAVTAAIAVDALGADNITGVAMPSPYSSMHSIDDARALANNLACRYLHLPIGGMLTAASEQLAGLVATGFAPDSQAGVAYENLQSRLRGLLLMALSNEHGSIVLTTGNKSEYAVGYATLYGDMAGGFAPLKDVPKMLVYELARWRNQSALVIPVSTIDKPPSAELRPGQLDQDSLPNYPVLDDVVTAYVEQNLDIEAIVARGHDEALVRRTVQMIDRAEYKRRQAAPGPKITPRAFGRDRRVPMTSGWTGRKSATD